VRYRATGSWQIRPAKDEEEPDDVWEIAKDANGRMVANWTNKVMSPTIAGGRAVLHVIVGSSGEQMGAEEVASLPSAGKSHTYLARRDGTMQLKHDDEESFDLAELYLELPDRQLRVGETWTSAMRVLPVPQIDTEVRVVRAKHRVEGFEWIAGHKCVCIRSEYKVDGEKIKLKLKAKAEQAAVFGGEMGAFPEDEMMAPMEEMGMEGEMGMGMEGEAKVSDEIETSYVGERLTYFAYEMNRPVKIVDIITHSLEVPRGAVGTMGMEEGMMEGEMMPEFAEEPPGGPGEGMPAGDEGFAEFGGFGGGFQTQPATPMKINVNVRLEISEVGF